MFSWVPVYPGGMGKLSTVSDQRPALRAHEESIGLPFDDLVTRLREILGVRLVGYIGGVKSARSVTSWADGQGAPGEKDQERLRHAYHAAALLRERYDAVTVQSWFKGINPSLGDQAPAQVLRDGEPLDVAREVLAAAKSFAYIG